MKTVARLGLLLLLLAPAAVPAQDPGMNEVMVTGSRIPRNFGNNEPVISRPAIGLRRTADFAVMIVTVAGDTREEQRRRDEIFAMVRSAIELAGRSGVELATGAIIVEPLTIDNYRGLPLTNDGRPDSEQVTFLVKTRLGGETDAAAALQRIERFVRAVPAAGRAEMRRVGELGLSVVAPDQYRGQILDLIAADSRAAAARFGPNYAVEVAGLDRPVQWMRASLTEVFLYVPYNVTVRPAG
ncbi:MAG TPA: TonB-dependent receptor [Allosphingosinicella sp.]|nr:TonB-dependent receptor [Allosphingosinicella sp.]